MPTVTDDPSQSLDWATSGTNVATPPSGDRVTGFVPGQRPPAQWVNYLFDAAKRWVASFVSQFNGRIEGPYYVEQATVAPVADADLDTFAIKVGRIGFCKVDGSVLTVDSDNVNFLDTDLADRTTYGGQPALYPQEVYHVYVGIDGTNPLWNLSRTPPDSVGVFKNTDPALRYVHSFCTDSRGWPIPHRRVGNRTLYCAGGGSAADVAPSTLLFAGGGSEVQRNLGAPSSASCLVPITSGRVALVHCLVTRNSASGQSTLRVRETTSLAAGNSRYVTFNSGELTARFQLTTQSTGGLTPYLSALGTDDLQVSIEGYELA